MATASLPTTAPAPIPRFRTVAQLQAHLGGIPAERIRLEPPPGQATEADLFRIREREARICELIDGILVEKVMAYYESRVASVLSHYIESYLDDRDLGVVSGEGGWLKPLPGQVRAPDVTFVSWRSMPNKEIPPDAVPALVPDLAVEILSESNTVAEMERKLQEYFQAGTKLVWYVDPKARTVRVYTSVRKSVLLTEADTLDGGKVLPGFSLSIKQWFQRAARRPRK